MNADEFRQQGREMVDFVANYNETLSERPVVPPTDLVFPGYLGKLLPNEPPQKPESFEAVMHDVNKHIIPGITNWLSPKFFAYFPVGWSYPSLLADLLCNGIGCIGFTWVSSPSCTELELVMMDWLAKMLDLPRHFLFESKGKGGGVIYNAACEATLAALLASRNRAFRDCGKPPMEMTNGAVLDRLVAFCSDQAHSGVERSGLLGAIKHFVKVPSDKKHAMRGDALQLAIDEAVGKGLIPFYVVATLGTTSTCSFDNLLEVGQVVERYNADESKPTKIWLHVDAAYAGSAFCCPEFRPLLNGVEYVDSFNYNPHKWMLMNFDCSAFWMKDASLFTDAFNVDPVYLQHKHQSSGVPDYRHWQLHLGRRFRSLKVFFVLRMFGVEKIQRYIRSHVEQAHYFESLVRADPRFEITNDVILGLVCFRLKVSDDLNECNTVNEELLKAIDADARIHITPTNVKHVAMLRFSICCPEPTKAQVDYGWSVIKEVTDRLMITKAKHYMTLCNAFSCGNAICKI